MGQGNALPVAEQTTLAAKWGLSVAELVMRGPTRPSSNSETTELK
jgi:hypothetical protein